jgi:hypothetical protein
MLEDFKRALARVQRDYGFYIDCQTNPAVALGGYDLSPDERSALTDSERLTDVLKGGIGVARLPSITIKISGTHDWVNRTRPKKRSMEDVGRDAGVARQIAAIRNARSDEERTGATLRLMELIG